jgi:putative endonuclease
MCSRARIELGKTGEDLACDELLRRGYAILARRFRTRCGELDIVAVDGDTLVFVEVKTRHHERFGTPAEAVTRRKQCKVSAMAGEYLAREHVGDCRCRFDVVSVFMPADGPVVLRVIRGAFDAPSR